MSSQPNQSNAVITKLVAVKTPQEIEAEQAKKHNRDTGEFKLANGQVIKCRPVPAQAFAELRMVFPPPKPPTQVTAVGVIKNDKHSDYLAALDKYENFIYHKGLQTAIELCVSAKQLEIDMGDVQEIRESMLSLGMPLTGVSDKVVYVTYILIPSDNELFELYDFVKSLGKPTAEEVATHRDSFSSNLPKEGE